MTLKELCKVAKGFLCIYSKNVDEPLFNDEELEIDLCSHVQRMQKLHRLLDIYGNRKVVEIYCEENQMLYIEINV